MVKEEKLKAVEKLREEIERSPVIGIVDMHKMPSKQLQDIRKELRDKAKLKIVKKIILKFAIDSAQKEKIKDIEALMPDQPAVVLTNVDAFKLYALSDKLRFKTFAKEGDIAEEDIWVSAGPTSLMAGPAISELQQAGVPASIESGKITVRKDACIVRAGEIISAIKANALRKLKIEPMEVVLNIVAVYENGDIYPKDVLKLTTEYPDLMMQAYNNALNLSVFIVFPTKENIKYLLAKAVQTAKAIKGLVAIEKKEEEKEEKTEEEKTEQTEEVTKKRRGKTRERIRSKGGIKGRGKGVTE